jgi:hypothetical protein
MDFLGGALPNVMFIVGILAIGLGLGIELKLVPLNKEIDRTGRIGAIVVGSLLVAGSVFFYLNPAIANRNQAASTANSAALAPAAQATGAVPQAAPTAAPAQAPAAADAPTATAIPTETPAPAEPPTATAIPTEPPTATSVPSVLVPDLRDMDEKGARSKLEQVGLAPKKVEKCSGGDQENQKAKKGRVQCQNPAPNQPVAPGSTVEYVLAGK